MKLHTKIVVPFTLLFVTATVVAAAVSVAWISRGLERRFSSQVERVSEMLSQSDFALNPSILAKMKLILDGEIVTFDRTGAIVASTLTEERGAELLGLLGGPTDLLQWAAAGERQLVRDVRLRGTPYKVTVRPLRTPAGTCVAVAVETSEVQQAKLGVARAIGTLALGMTVAMALLGFVLARRITSPIQRLALHTRALARGELTQRIEIEGHDEIAGLAAAFNDMAVQLRSYEERLVHSEKLAVTGQLAARVAHDIRTPLSSLKMQAQILRTRLDERPAVTGPLSAILRDVDRMEWVIEGLLDLARPGRLVLAPENVNNVLAEALDAMRAQLEHARIVIAAEHDPSLPQTPLDAERLKLALLNLIQNAAEAMPQGGRLCTVTSPSADGATVCVEIRDNGVGIDPVNLDRVFDPFFTTKREGVGLGLVNARSVIERHGGSLELRSRGTGSTAVITLPVRGGPSPAEDRAAAASDPPGPGWQ